MKRIGKCLLICLSPFMNFTCERLRMLPRPFHFQWQKLELPMSRTRICQTSATWLLWHRIWGHVCLYHLDHTACLFSRLMLSIVFTVRLFGWIQSSLLALNGIAQCVWIAARRMRYVIWWLRHFTDHWAHQNTRFRSESWWSHYLQFLFMHKLFISLLM